MLHDPPEKVNGDVVLNMQFKTWKRQDEMLGCWLITCMTDDILKQVGNFGTTRDVWTILEKSFNP